jgi:hypothetical protein
MHSSEALVQDDCFRAPAGAGRAAALATSRSFDPKLLESAGTCAFARGQQQEIAFADGPVACRRFEVFLAWVVGPCDGTLHVP